MELLIMKFHTKIVYLTFSVIGKRVIGNAKIPNGQVLAGMINKHPLLSFTRQIPLK
jgi:hypothetical protein